MCLALYHVVQRKTTILAGVLVPALILFTYTFFVIHVSNRDKKRRKKMVGEFPYFQKGMSDFKVYTFFSQEANELQRIAEEVKAEAEAKKTPPLPIITAIPSTSGRPIPGLIPSTSQNLSKGLKSNLKQPIEAGKIPKAPNNKSNASAGAKKKAPLKKIPSQSHIQVKSNPSTHIVIENEIKKLKKSRSFDKNNHLESRHLVVDNKKLKTKH
jgi:hypothetical protein